jgi:hypothetical protein
VACRQLRPSPRATVQIVACQWPPCVQLMHLVGPVLHTTPGSRQQAEPQIPAVLSRLPPHWPPPPQAATTSEEGRDLSAPGPPVPTYYRSNVLNSSHYPIPNGSTQPQVQAGATGAQESLRPLKCCCFVLSVATILLPLQSLIGSFLSIRDQKVSTTPLSSSAPLCQTLALIGLMHSPI